MAQKSNSYSKIEVAIELMLCAKNLYQQENHVCATILAGAAQQIVRDLCKANQIEPTIKTLAEHQCRDGTELHDFISFTYNKLKHANREQNDVVVGEDEARVLIELAATDLIRLKVNPNQSIVEILNFVKHNINVV